MLTVSPSMLCAGGGCRLREGGSNPGGWGVSAAGGVPGMAGVPGPVGGVCFP